MTEKAINEPHMRQFLASGKNRYKLGQKIELRADGYVWVGHVISKSFKAGEYRTLINARPKYD